MSNIIKNPAPSANGSRASKRVKAHNSNKQNTTPNSVPLQRLVLDAAVSENGTERFFAVRGQTAKALRALIGAGSSGCTASEVADWAYCFTAYCHSLKHNHGLEIRTDKEAHAGGWHGRYVLVSNVRIRGVRYV